MSAFWEKYKDPRWQKRRLEIMSIAGFACQNCGDKETTLNVHHKLYRKNADPWDYSDDELECLCEPCHEIKHEQKTMMNQVLAAAYAPVGDLVGLVAGYLDAQMGIESAAAEMARQSSPHMYVLGLAAASMYAEMARTKSIDAAMDAIVKFQKPPHTPVIREMLRDWKEANGES